MQGPNLGVRSPMFPAADPTPRVHERLAEGAVGSLVLAEAIALGETLGTNSDGHQIVSANRGSEERNMARPTTKRMTATPTPTPV